MATSERSNIERKIASLELTLSSVLKGLSGLAVLILVVLLLLIYISARDLFTTSEPQFVDSVVPTPLPQQTNAEIERAATASNLNAALAQELRSAELLTFTTQRSLEESQIQLGGIQRELEETQAQLEGTRGQLGETRAQLEENQVQLDETRQALQQALLGDEELVRVRQELTDQTAEASARLIQYQEGLEDAQRHVRELQSQRNQLMEELAALRDVPGVNQDLATEFEEIAEDPPSIVDSPQIDIVVQEELVRRAPANYPSRAANRNIEGSCEVEFTVTADGEVSNPVIVESDPRGVFDNACLDAIVDFEYRPKTINGVPVNAPGVRITFRFEFN